MSKLVLSPAAEAEVLSVFKIIQDYFCPECPVIKAFIESKDYQRIFLHDNWVSYVSSYLHGHISHGAASKHTDVLFRYFPNEVGFIYRQILSN